MTVIIQTFLGLKFLAGSVPLRWRCSRYVSWSEKRFRRFGLAGLWRGLDGLASKRLAAFNRLAVGLVVAELRWQAVTLAKLGGVLQVQMQMRRPKPYPLLTKPRAVARQSLRETVIRENSSKCHSSLTPSCFHSATLIGY